MTGENARCEIVLWRGADGLDERLDALRFGGAPATPFQSHAWLSAWYRAFGAEPGQTPLVALAVEAGGGAGAAVSPERLVCAFPLVARRRYGLPLVEWADRGVTDYNLPLLGPAWTGDADGALEAVSRAVRPYARLALRKMPAVVLGIPNPLAAARRAAPDPLRAYHMSLSGGREAIAARLGKKKMRTLRRSERLLEEAGGAPVFRFAEGAAERAAVLGLVRRSQADRHGGSDDYLLERPAYAGFYEDLVAAPATRDLVRLAALWRGEEPVAGLFALVDPGHCIVLRLGLSDAPEVVRAGPMKLLMVSLAFWAAERGLPVLDLSLGGNALKDWLRCEPQPLVKVTRWANGLV